MHMLLTQHCRRIALSALTIFTLSACGGQQEPAPPSPELVAAGQAVFETNCMLCHSIAPGAPGEVGPNLHGVYGRAAGSGDFAYSEPMANAGLTWSRSTIDQFLQNPAALIPGTTMQFPGLPDEADRNAVIVYLQSQQ